MNRSRRGEVDGAEAPEPNHEYLFYQSLVGAWPLDLDAADGTAMQDFAHRMGAFMQKAVREGKERSSWGNPNAPYEEAVSRFVEGTLQVSSTNPFPQAFAEFLDRRVARCGAVNSLAQTALKLTLPGVPDIYRGAELWDFSLVDPDNRRPVDYPLRRRLIENVLHQARDRPGTAERRLMLRDFATDWRDGREKLFLIAELLRFRARHPGLFAQGDYEALNPTGERADHVCAFKRERQDALLIVAVPRLPATLRSAVGRWRDTALPLPDGRYRDLLSCRSMSGGGPQRADELFGDFPVAVLTRDG
jgi:(1->4)-alpha-D-glucan 1-alpha-D-glucosylmutase